MAGEGVGVSERVALSTIAKWLKSLSSQVERKYAFLAMLKSKGNIEYGCHGGQLRWAVKYRDHDLSAHVDGAPKQFAKVKTIFNAFLDWRGYDSSEIITLREKAEHGGAEAMIEIFAGREKMMREGLLRQLGREWYKDGNATGNEHTFHGIESFCSVGAQTAADELATAPNDSYAGTSTAYTSLKATAVKGVDEEHGVWSPVIVNTNRTPSGGSLRTWEEYADEYIRLGVIEAQYGTSQDENLDLILLTKTAYRQFLSVVDDKERINISRGSELGLTKMGFANVVEFDGVQVMWDDGISATDGQSNTVHGYGFNCDQLALKVLGGGARKTLFGAKVTWNDDYASDRIYLWLLGQLCFYSPRRHVKFCDIS